MSKLAKVIAIDGPSGSGKSTVAKKLAQVLDVLYIDTGAMFRALAYYCDKEKIPFNEGKELESFLTHLKLEYATSPGRLIVVNGEDLTQKIREHHVSKLASIISQLPSVRRYLLDFQRQVADEKVCVMEGRDIGTVVFPRAFCKFFVTASVEVRSQRRLEQLQESGDQNVTLEKIVADVKKRDESDMNREVAPLKLADDAELIDTGDMQLDEVVFLLEEKCRQRAREVGISL